ncbi:uncharacterized protein LOC129616509 [Condylostylus longicornis]|uniref:uncharacterized protein LOC129616509 n=1 Tax=Condylostylus longicornis TaxID=2530218 RepID=UPI00244E1997|nr:uncharacterized protein LOC129616509 [Condylostylus longicornis]
MSTSFNFDTYITGDLLNECKAAYQWGKSCQIRLAAKRNMDPQTAVELIHPHIRNNWETETIPKTWKKGVIAKIPYQKRGLSNCNNWSTITLLNTTYKILTGANKSCLDQTNTPRIIVEQAHEWITHLCLIFVDFKKAFDSIHRNAIRKALEKMRKNENVPRKIINIMMNMYENV